MASPWLFRAQRDRPYAVERDPASTERETRYRATEFDEPAAAAAVQSGVPQTAPPLIPSTVEQQQRMGAGAAEQYGGARPWNNLGETQKRADPATLAAIGLGLGLAWMVLRQK